MARITEKDCKEAFELLAKALGKSTETFNKETRQYNIGSWQLDYNSIYGGAIIREIINENGGVTDPILKYRLSPKQFVTAVEFALKVLNIYTREQTNEIR
ncbi:MAG: hypothetical protein QXV73_03960 [Candidatus Micrarchaeia archaeon]